MNEKTIGKYGVNLTSSLLALADNIKLFSIITCDTVIHVDIYDGDLLKMNVKYPLTLTTPSPRPECVQFHRSNILDHRERENEIRGKSSVRPVSAR